MISLKEIHESNEMTLEELQNHIVQLNKTGHLQYSRQRLQKHNPETTYGYIQDLKLAGGRFFLILSADEISGTITLRWHDKGCRSVGIFVYEHLASLGVAYEAIQLVTRVVRLEGADMVHVGTSISNMPMRRVSERLGFILQGFNKDASMMEVHYKKWL